ncbi:unnamed protein product [Mytilus edulis]|uniref:Uncharacterized protein n=1 Tax=Mytilus edulis TaxID=6550 RepID=A0A8S3TYG2_MYTED|nr:unnamed protein product [Mytilus edulis]
MGENPVDLRRWMITGPEMARLTKEFESTVSDFEVEEDEHHHENKTSVQKSFLKDIWSMVEVMNETPHGKTVSAMKDKISILKSDVSLFSRLYISCQTRGGDLEDFFAHENNINPPALSQHGKMRLGTKSDLLSKCLEPLTTTTCDAPEVDALVIDGAAIVNMLKPSTSRNSWTLKAVILMIVIPSIVLTFVFSFTICTLHVLICDDEYQLAASWIVLGLAATTVYAVGFCFYFKPSELYNFLYLANCLL